MTDADRQWFAEMMGTMFSMFGTEATKLLLHGYWIGLKDVQRHDLERAFERALKSCKFMPKVAELREMAGAETSDVKALRAFGAVRAAVRKYGTIKSVDFGPEVNAAVRACGGWARVCSTTTEEFESFLRRDFERAFTAYLQTAPTANEAQPLLGRFGGPPVVIQLEGEPERPRLTAGSSRPLLEPADTNHRPHWSEPREPDEDERPTNGTTGVHT